MIINTANLDSLFVAFNNAFQSGLSSQANADWAKVASSVPSSSSKNLYAWLKRWPKMRQWVGDRHILNLESESYELVNKHYESTVGVNADDIADDQYGAYEPMFSMEGFSAANHPNELIFELLLAGHSTLCFDGQYFLDTDHSVAGASVSNYDATGGGNMWALLDTRWPIKPLILQKRKDYNMVAINKPTDENVFMRNEFLYGIDARLAAGFGFWQMAYGSLNTLSATNFNSAYAAMQAFKDDEGRPLGIRPNLLVCGPSNRAAALAIIKADKDAAGATNVNFQATDLLVTEHMT